MIDTSYNAQAANRSANGGAAHADAAAAAGASAGGAAGAGNSASTDSAAGTEDRFLKLLVAQMRNQDPLNPLDNAQVTSQLAQINTVRGIEQLNASMRTLAAASAAVSPMSAVGLLGRQVLVAGDDFQWNGADAAHANDDPTAPTPPAGAAPTVRLGFDLAATARAVRVEVVDATGQVVHARDFDAPEAGVHTFDWDGVAEDGRSVAAGKYRLRAYGIDSGGGESTVSALVPARVHGVNQAADGVRVELTGRSALPSSAIRAVL